MCVCLRFSGAYRRRYVAIDLATGKAEDVEEGNNNKSETLRKQAYTRSKKVKSSFTERVETPRSQPQRIEN